MDIVHKKDTWEPTFGAYKNCIVLYDDNCSFWGQTPLRFSSERNGCEKPHIRIL